MCASSYRVCDMNDFSNHASCWGNVCCYRWKQIPQMHTEEEAWAKSKDLRLDQQTTLMHMTTLLTGQRQFADPAKAPLGKLSTLVETSIMPLNRNQTTYLSSEWAKSPAQLISLMSLSLIVGEQTQPNLGCQLKAGLLNKSLEKCWAALPRLLQL